MLSMRKSFVVPKDIISTGKQRLLLYRNSKLVKQTTNENCREEMRKLIIAAMRELPEDDLTTIISKIERQKKLKHKGTPKNKKEQIQLLTTLLKFAEKKTRFRISILIEEQNQIEINYGRYSAFTNINGKTTNLSIKPAQKRRIL